MSIFTNPISAAAEEAEAYTEAVLELLGDRDPMAVLAELPDAVERLLEELPDERLRRPEAPGKWSMLAVVQHLADSDLVWAWRLRQVVAEDRPRIVGYDQDAWAERLGYDEVEVADALAQLRLLRRLNLKLLRSLPVEALDRVGVHSERGEESIRHMIRLYAGHDLVHRRQLERIRRGLER